MDAVVFCAAFAVIAAFAFLLVRPFDGRILVGTALLCAAYLALDDLVTGLPTVVRSLDVLGGDWNWTGKVLSLVLSAVVIVALRLCPAAVGLVWKQRHATTGVIALALYVVWGSCLGLLFQPGAADAETLVFQATMPGLSEELVYRGIAPAILLGLTRRGNPVDDIPWAVILGTAVVFGAWHGLRYEDGQFGFDVMSALFPFIGSIPGGWLRFRTGSLVIPVLAHGLANLAFHVAGGLGPVAGP